MRPEEIEALAWECYFRALKDWKHRDAPDPVLRAVKLAHNMGLRPSDVRKLEEEIERFGGAAFDRMPRRRRMTLA